MKLDVNVRLCVFVRVWLVREFYRCIWKIFGYVGGYLLYVVNCGVLVFLLIFVGLNCLVYVFVKYVRGFWWFYLVGCLFGKYKFEWGLLI